MAFDHAAHCSDHAARARLFESGRFNNRLERFLFRSVDEAARVDDDEVSLVGARHRLGAEGDQFGDVAFGVDGVLVAAEGDEVEAHI